MSVLRVLVKAVLTSLIGFFMFLEARWMVPHL